MENLWLFDENKIRILYTLYQSRNDVCGNDLVEQLDIPKNLLSYHIKTLREKGFIEEVRCGRKKNYQITKEKLPTVIKALEITGLMS